MSEPVVTASGGRFYGRRDWLAGGIAGVVAFLGYLFTLAPGVTLEDSGEFVTAAYGFGVPHPPGYPIWTLLAWVWCHVVPFGNIAWRMNLMSAVFGAAACGVVALLVSKSGHVLVRQVGFLKDAAGRGPLERVVLASSITAGLLLAFGPVMWSQSVITEVYGLNAFLLMVTLALLYQWSFEPERRGRLYLAALVWGVGLTAHQTLVLLTVAFPTFIWLTDRKFGRHVLAPVIVLATLGVLAQIGRTWATIQYLEQLHDQMPATGANLPPSPWGTYKFPMLVYVGLIVGAGYWLRQMFREADWVGPAMTLVGVLAVMGLVGGFVLWRLEGDRRGALAIVAGLLAGGGFIGWWMMARNRQPEAARHAIAALLVYGAVCVGLMVYGYLYFAARTNPPMNWGHCSDWEGFKHHFTRGQYDKVRLDRPLLQFWGQLNMFFDDLQGQFNVLYALVALIVVFFFLDLGDRDRSWLKFLLISFLCLGIGFIFLSNPTFEKQKQFTDRVFFLPCHCLYSLWIGYGLMLGIGYLYGEKPALQQANLAVAIVVLLLPVGSWWRNWANEEQRGHDFGYRYGYLMFKPGGGYREMDRNAILYGGTDPGRFVPTYMIFVESFTTAKSRFAKCPDSATFDRRDVYLITQNALADTTYMAYLRDHYSASRPRSDDPRYPAETIWIPSDHDVQQAFGRYVEELKTRTPLPGEDVRIENGQVSVQGIVGITAINGLLSREIFEQNKDRHTFYVEESYALPWMYPYLEPYGVIMKLNPEPLPALAPEKVARDTAYWDALTKDLLDDPKFRRDDLARQCYSKLRSALGGLYASRRMFKDAERVFLQSIQLCPESPEANFRLAQLYIEQQRFDDAISLLEAYHRRDAYNAKIAEAIQQIKKMRDDIAATAELERQMTAQPGNQQIAMQLARAYASAQRLEAFDRVVNELVGSGELPQTDFLQLISYNAQLNRSERVATLLGDFTRRHPQNAIGWYNYACILSLRGNCPDAMPALARALQLDGPDRQLHQVAMNDKRLANCRNTEPFQKLLIGGALPAGTNSPALPFQLGK